MNRLFSICAAVLLLLSAIPQRLCAQADTVAVDSAAVLPVWQGALWYGIEASGNGADAVRAYMGDSLLLLADADGWVVYRQWGISGFTMLLHGADAWLLTTGKPGTWQRLHREPDQLLTTRVVPEGADSLLGMAAARWSEYAQADRYVPPVRWLLATGWRNPMPHHHTYSLHPQSAASQQQYQPFLVGPQGLDALPLRFATEDDGLKLVVNAVRADAALLPAAWLAAAGLPGLPK